MAPKLLLTGGSGMVGKNVLEHPKALEWKVLAPSSKDLNLLDSDSVLKYLRENKPDIIVHAAGLVGGIQSNIEDPISYLDQNLLIGRNIIIGAYRSGVKRFLNIASSCMYPRNAESPLQEDSILSGELEPTNEGYALAKIVSARFCEYIQKRDQTLSYKSLIPCNLYGRFDKFGAKNSHLVAAIIHKIHNAKINGEGVVEIWGNGSARRQFMFASDLADAIFKAAHEIDSIPNLMNIAPSEDFSVDDYYKMVKKILNWNGTFTHDLSKPEGMQKKLASTHLQSLWGWQPKTGLSEGIKEAYRYYCLESGFEVD